MYRWDRAKSRGRVLVHTDIPLMIRAAVSAAFKRASRSRHILGRDRRKIGNHPHFQAGKGNPGIPELSPPPPYFHRVPASLPQHVAAAPGGGDRIDGINTPPWQLTAATSKIARQRCRSPESSSYTRLPVSARSRYSIPSCRQMPRSPTTSRSARQRSSSPGCGYPPGCKYAPPMPKLTAARTLLPVPDKEIVVRRTAVSSGPTPVTRVRQGGACPDPVSRERAASPFGLRQGPESW